ncbi:hypothetical protein KO317_02310 [Candidatus Micrarchaeota archaeon]|jgi:hypothetical protein|nr:hypothetical protein [Candidatus Micrarchaeota archaeon]
MVSNVYKIGKTKLRIKGKFGKKVNDFMANLFLKQQRIIESKIGLTFEELNTQIEEKYRTPASEDRIIKLKSTLKNDYHAYTQHFTQIEFTGIKPTKVVKIRYVFAYPSPCKNGIENVMSHELGHELIFKYALLFFPKLLDNEISGLVFDPERSSYGYRGEGFCELLGALTINQLHTRLPSKDKNYNIAFEQAKEEYLKTEDLRRFLEEFIIKKLRNIFGHE